MDLFNLSLVNIAKNRLDYLSERQKVIATNIANADTPGYVSQDVEEPDFAGLVKNSMSAPLKMAVTNPKHMASAPVQGGMYKVYTPKPDTALTIDGNGVNIEDQLNEASKVKSEHERILTIYNKYKSMLQTANTKINS